MTMTRSTLASSLLASLVALTLGGCVIVDGDGDDSGADTGNSSNTNTNGSVDETGGNAQQVADCKMACDDLQFFSCITADDLASCYGACETRGSSDLDLFIACVDNTKPSCDEGVPCYENLIMADPPDSGTGGSGGSGGSGETPGSCADACEEWLGAGCMPFSEAPSCDVFCDALSDPLQQAVVDCVENRDGCTLPPECDIEGGAEGG